MNYQAIPAGPAKPSAIPSRLWRDGSSVFSNVRLNYRVIIPTVLCVLLLSAVVSKSNRGHMLRMSESPRSRIPLIVDKQIYHPVFLANPQISLTQAGADRFAPAFPVSASALSSLADHTTTHIYNGDVSSDKIASKLGYVYIFRPGNELSVCTAVVVHRQWVLTAAHCVNEEWTRIFVYIGSRRRPDFKTDIPYKAVKVYKHANFKKYYAGDKSWAPSDLAMMKLSKQIADKQFGGVATLSKTDEKQPPVTSALLVAGFGLLGPKNEGLTSELMQLDVDVVAADTCTANIPQGNDDKIPTDKEFICGEPSKPYAFKYGICKGDSGGALFSKTADGQLDTVYGITSSGGGQGACENPFYFTRVSYHYADIVAIMGGKSDNWKAVVFEQSSPTPSPTASATMASADANQAKETVSTHSTIV